MENKDSKLSPGEPSSLTCLQYSKYQQKTEKVETMRLHVNKSSENRVELIAEGDERPDDHAILKASQSPNYHNYTFKMSLSEVVEDHFFLRFDIFAIKMSMLSSIDKLISGIDKELNQVIRENFRVSLHFEEVAGKSALEESVEYHIKGDGWCGYRAFYRIYLAGI